MEFSNKSCFVPYNFYSKICQILDIPAKLSRGLQILKDTCAVVNVETGFMYIKKRQLSEVFLSGIERSSNSNWNVFKQYTL